MKLLIEDYEYSDPEILPFLNLVDSKKKDGKSRFVGYLFSKELNDCVFFLPKVILDKDGKVLGKYDPAELWNINQEILQEQNSFFRTFPIWIYQAINIYNRCNTNNSIVVKQQLSSLDPTETERHVPFIENLLELVHFANENKNFLLFKIMHLYDGQSKVNWPKTISHNLPYLKKGKAPIYLNPYAKKKEIDYEEELLVIFFSVLRYINDQYGFSTDINLNFQLIPKSRFDDYLHGEGSRRLRNIRYKYFSDKTLRIWRLCYAFFSTADKINSATTYSEFLLASDFDRVFEAMVDDIIGTELPKHIRKAQEDGKEIDHLFEYDSLIDKNRKTFYIADSKYYKTKDQKEIDGNSLFKQYTYARNLIQEDLEERRDNSNSWKEYFPCRDDKTEGYNIIPNFFLSAYITPDHLNYDEKGIYVRPNENQKTFHFLNRLFDRETLLVQHYDINFLYVLKLYASNDTGSKLRFRTDIHQQFRTDILKRLNEEYKFSIYELKQKPVSGQEYKALQDAINPIFRLLNGKIICPEEDKSFTRLIVALEKEENPKLKREFSRIVRKQNNNVLEALNKDFVKIRDLMLGEDYR